MREVHPLLLLHRVHADPVDLRVPRLVVLLHARVHAAAAPDAAGEVEGVGELHAGEGGGVGHRHRGAVGLGVLPLELAERGAQPLLRHLDEPLRAARGEEEARRGRRGARRRTRRRDGSGAVARVAASWKASHRLLRPLRPAGRRLRRERPEAGLVGVVAVGAEQVALLPVPARRCGARAPPPSSRAASRRGTGRRAGRTARTGSARRSPGGASRGPSRRGSPGTSGAARRAGAGCRRASR